MSTTFAKRSVQLQERINSDTSLRVDKASGVIRGVKILGKRSKNGREYTDAAMNQAARLYEGIRVNLDHPSRRNGDPERSIADGFGVLRGVRRRGDGVYGDLHYLKSHPLAEAVTERAERMPHTFGLSHNADGKVSSRGGKKVVESVERVKSVDLVDQPATSTGLFESKQLGNYEQMLNGRTLMEAMNDPTLVEVNPATGVLKPVSKDPVEYVDADDSDKDIKVAAEKAVLRAWRDRSTGRAATLKRIGEVFDMEEASLEMLSKWESKDDEPDVPNSLDDPSLLKPPKRKPFAESVELREYPADAREFARAIG